MYDKQQKYIISCKPCHRKYSQSEYRKAIVHLSVLQPTFLLYTALFVLPAVFSMVIV